MGNLVKPKGKPENRQSFLYKILELDTASPTNLIFKILPIFRLLWIWYSVELRFIIFTLQKYDNMRFLQTISKSERSAFTFEVVSI